MQIILHNSTAHYITASVPSPEGHVFSFFAATSSAQYSECELTYIPDVAGRKHIRTSTAKFPFRSISCTHFDDNPARTFRLLSFEMHFNVLDNQLISDHTFVNLPYSNGEVSTSTRYNQRAIFTRKCIQSIRRCHGALMANKLCTWNKLLQEASWSVFKPQIMRRQNFMRPIFTRYIRDCLSGAIAWLFCRRTC